MAGLLAVSVLLSYSCKENVVLSSDSFKTDLQLLSKVEKEAAEELSTDLSEELIIEEILDEVIADLEQFDFLKSEETCPVKTIVQPDTARYPKVVTKDYGDGCIDARGVERSGKIIVTIYGPWLKKGSLRTVTFEQYTRNGVAVSGEKEILCLGLNEDNLFVHRITGEVELVKPDGVIVKREIHKRRTLLTDPKDRTALMEWLIDGRVIVEKSTGVSYEMHVREPLYRIQGCKWFQSGIKRIVFEVKDENLEEPSTHRILIDYGYAESEDSCDNYALRTVDDQEPVAIQLK
jgi:hypothetical protein